MAFKNAKLLQPGNKKGGLGNSFSQSVALNVSFRKTGGFNSPTTQKKEPKN